MSILEILVKNGIDVSDESFIRDITFLTESIKASILKLHGIDHPIQGLIEITTELQIDPNDTTFCELDEDTITSLIATYNSIMMKD